MKRFVLILAFLLSSVAAGLAQTDAKDDAELTALVKQMASAQVAFDVPALDRILTSDYVEISPAGEFDPRDKVLGFYKVDTKPPAVPALDVSEVSIRNYGKFAIVIARLTYRMPTADKAAPARSMRVTFACRREKGDWKIASSQYTGIRPPPAPKT